MAFPPPLAFIVNLGLGFAIQYFAPLHFSRNAAAIDALEVVGGVLVFLAGAIALWAFIRFRRAHTSPLPDRPATSLVVDGPFRFSRNPLYLSMGLIHTGVSLFANAVWPFVFLVPALVAIRLFVVAREERYLLARFGAEYEAYRNTVRRWL